MQCEVKEFGTIKAELYPKVAPITVTHIVSLINDKFYDGLTFHRVMDDFMIQGGDPTGTGFGQAGQTTIKGEFTDNGVVNDLQNVRGVLAMARRNGEYDSATSQFFINTADNPHLDGQYATFGMVTEGMDVVDAISKVETDSSDKPLSAVVISTIRVIKGSGSLTTVTDAVTSAPVTDAPITDEPPATLDLDAYLVDPIHIEIVFEQFGTVKADLYPKVAPITVAHLVSLIEDKFYDGLTIHRIDPDFVIQGGDPAGTGMGVEGQETIKGEFLANGVNNPLGNRRGVLAMARRSNDNDSASSQFFINLTDNNFLDGQYATFGMVIEGMDVVDAIAKVETGASERPVTPVVITSIRIVE